MRITGEYVLSTKGSTRGTAYAMSNKIVRLGDRLYVSWLDWMGTCMVNVLDLKTGKLGEAFALGETDQVDNHCGPALVSTSDGHLHAIVGAHHRKFRYRRTIRTGDIGEWTDEKFGPDSTYPSLTVGPDDTLHLACRSFFPRGEACKLTYANRPPDGKWSDAVAVALTPARVDYTHYGNVLLCDPRGVLHLNYHCYQKMPVVSSPSQLYLRSSDSGRTWTHSDGTPVVLPATIDSAECIAHRPQSIMRGQGLACDATGRIFALGGSREDAYTVLHRLESSGRWTSIDLLPAVHRLGLKGHCHQEGTMTFDSTGRMYIALDVTPPSGSWGDPLTETVLLHSDDEGKTFDGLRVSPIDPTTANWLSSIERQTGPTPIEGPPAILYTHGEIGSGCTPPQTTEIRLVIFAR